MNRELKTGLLASLGVVVLVVGFVFLVRYAVPAVLALRFAGSLIAAVVVAVVGVLLLVAAAWRLWLWLRRALSN